MTLAFAGWNYELVLPFALTAAAFGVHSQRSGSVSSVSVQVKRSLVFWAVGFVFAAAVWLLLGSDSAAHTLKSSWSVQQLHKAVGLSIGAVLVTYLPFLVVAVISHGRPWRSSAVYATVLAVILIPLFAATPMLAAAGAILSCVLLQVSQCL